MIFCIKIADYIFKINSTYDYIYKYCVKFLVETTNYDYYIRSSEDDIIFEKKYLKESDINDPKYVELEVVYRKIAEILIEKDILLIHGSAIASLGDSVIFTAKSGTGKSSHVSRWLTAFNNCYVVNGDKPLVSVSDSCEVIGTPWSGKERLYKNCRVNLKAICLMKRSNQNKIKKLSNNEVFPILINQVYKPNDIVLLKKTLSLVKKLIHNVIFYEYECNNYEVIAPLVTYTEIFGKERIDLKREYKYYSYLKDCLENNDY